MGANIVDVNAADYETAVIQSDVPTIVDVWAPWCGPCKQLTPILESLAEQYGDKVKIAKVNIDNNRELSAALNIKGVPTMIAYRGGEVVERMQGFGGRPGVEEFVKKSVG